MSTPMPTSAPTSVAAAAEHPPTLQEQAFALYCSGLRSPAIAKQLGTPERTVRAWIHTLLDEQAANRSNNLQAIAALAEERQLQIAAAAWESYHRLATFEQLQLNELQYGTHAEFAAHPPHITAAGARYLALAQRATHEVARLQGAYACPLPKPAGVDIAITMAYPSPSLIQPPHDQPNLSGPALERYRYEKYIAGLEAQCKTDQDTLVEARAHLAALQSDPAIPASVPSADSEFPAESATAPATTPEAAPPFPAESAIVPTPLAAEEPPVLTAGASCGRPELPEIQLPAESTPSAPGSTAACQPTSPYPPLPSSIIASSPFAAPLSAHGEGSGVRSPGLGGEVSWVGGEIPTPPSRTCGKGAGGLGPPA